MQLRYLIQDTLVAWYGAHSNGRKLLGLSIFTQTTDSLSPYHAAKKFRDWLVCSQTASGVSSDLVASAPPGHFDPLMVDFRYWFAEGNLIACPPWPYRVCAPGEAPITEVAAAPGPGPDLQAIISQLGI